MKKQTIKYTEDYKKWKYSICRLGRKGNQEYKLKTEKLLYKKLRELIRELKPYNIEVYVKAEGLSMILEFRRGSYYCHRMFGRKEEEPLKSMAEDVNRYLSNLKLNNQITYN